MERRRTPRIRCSFPCELVACDDAIAGTVRNVSESGLGIDAPIGAFHEGDSVTVTLRPPSRSPVEILAHVWHVRAVRRAGGERFAQLGLVLAQAREDYFRLVSLLAPPKPAAPDVPPPGVVAGSRFAVQVAQADSSRTRRIVVLAADAEAAAVRAQAEAGAGWSVVQVRPARA